MSRKYVLALWAFLVISSQAFADPASFKALEDKVYDVRQLTKMGTDYATYTKYVSEMGLALGRFERDLNGSSPSAYEGLIKKAAELYVEAKDAWGKSISISGDPLVVRI